MEEQKDILNLMTQPAFCVENGVITQLNHAATQLMLEPGTPIADLLPPDCEDYDQFREGCLYLTLQLAGHPMEVSVTPVQGCHLFVAVSEADQAELKALALTATGLRQLLSDMVQSANSMVDVAQSSDAPNAMDQLAKLNRQIYQMHRLVCNMADAARYAGEGTANLVCRDLAAVVEEFFEHAQTLISQCGYRLEYRVPNESILCLIDDQLLERAVYNTISNAVKFSEPGSTIRASLTRQGHRVYLRVEDSGSGIPPHIIGNVFSRYQRLPGLEDGRFGLGLGLVLVRAAATLHGGTVLIDQPAGCGTRITVSFPINQGRGTELRSHPLQVDYASERDHALVELSDVLPASLYLSAF